MKESSRRTILLKIVARGPVGDAVVETETVVQPTDDPSSAVRFVVGGISEQARHAPLGHVELRAFESVTAQYRSPIAAACLGLGVVDKSCQKPRNWCVSEMSADHYEYVVGDIEMPLKFLKVLFKTESLDRVLEKIDKQHPWYQHYA